MNSLVTIAREFISACAEFHKFSDACSYYPDEVDEVGSAQ